MVSYAAGRMISSYRFRRRVSERLFDAAGVRERAPLGRNKRTVKRRPPVVKVPRPVCRVCGRSNP